MAEAVYILCTITSLACAGLLFRSYMRSRMRLLLWPLLCFVGLGINNILLFVDLVLVPDVNFAMYRGVAGIGGLGALIYGLIWDVA